MTKMSVLLAAAAFVLAGTQAGPALAASGPSPAPVTPGPGARTARDAAVVAVVGRGSVEAVPDRMRLNVGVEVRREKAGEAFAAVKSAASKLTGALVSAGIPKADMRTNDLALAAEYEKYPKVVGYRASQGFEVVLRDLSRADAVVDAVAGVGEEVRLNGISFDVSKPSALLEAARAAAYRDATAKARQYAALAGRQLGRLIKLEEEGEPSSSRFAMAEKSSISPGQGSVTLTLRVVYELL
ncbi:SIMPL domain-containing protein [Sphaerisporangium fuscum]|uniref:SIMPL domain-containing protein n=1 Tax=Sphaerisporangium fuscum TaxID=2835868 RepID=UPI001BDC4395|nr:SIMPL domain-containing protein [Sphaerisporangium fuscum]